MKSKELGASTDGGGLYVVAVPLGNLGDITVRAKETLENVDEWVVEDTRRAGRLREELGIAKKPMTSYYDEVEELRTDELIEKLYSGLDLALFSDAGTPLVSDPGHYLIEACWAEGISVVPVPGVSAPPTALSVSAFPMDEYLFLGFLPKKDKAIRDKLLEVQYFSGTVVFFESPRRIHQTLQKIRSFLGDRLVFLGREMTKMHEEYLRGPVSELEQRLAADEPKGEFTVLIHPADDPDVDAKDYLRDLLEKGVQLKDAAKAAARFSKYSKSELYSMGLEMDVVE